MRQQPKQKKFRVKYFFITTGPDELLKVGFSLCRTPLWNKWWSK